MSKSQRIAPRFSSIRLYRATRLYALHYRADKAANRAASIACENGGNGLGNWQESPRYWHHATRAVALKAAADAAVGGAL